MAELTDAQERERQAIQDGIMDLAKTRDTGLMFMALITNAAMVAERLLAAQLVTPEKIASLFDEAKVDALTPTNRPVAIQYKDGDELLGRKP